MRCEIVELRIIFTFVLPPSLFSLFFFSAVAVRFFSYSDAAMFGVRRRYRFRFVDFSLIAYSDQLLSKINHHNSNNTT